MSADAARTPVAAVILAAGASRRLGFPKQLARLADETLLERVVRVSFEAGLDPVIGVLAVDLALDPPPSGMMRVDNPNAAEGMASSILAGLKALQHLTSLSGAVILACDQPAVTPSHLQKLICRPNDIVASSYAGRKGIPAYFPATHFRQLLALRGEVGARDLLRTARAIALTGGELDIDSVEDLDQARKLYSP